MLRKGVPQQSPTSAVGVTWLLLLTLSYLCHAAVVKAQTHPEARTHSLDIAVATQESGGVTIFWADTEGGAIYAKRVKGDAPAEVALKDFSLFFKAPELPAPSALAYHEGKLFVCDAKAAALYEINVEKGDHRILLQAPVLQRPTAVAVSERGSIVVGDSASNRAIWYDTGKKAVVSDDNFSANRRMVFAGSELLSLVSAYKIVRSGSGLESQGMRPVEGLDGRKYFIRGWREERGAHVPDNSAFTVAKELTNGSISDFTYYRGIYYLADGRGILSYTRSGRFALPLPRTTSPHAVRIGASDYHLFVADGARKTLSIIPRPVPVKVSFESASGSDADDLALTQQEALASLYLYLASRNILPVRVYAAPHDMASVYGLLVEQRVLFPSRDDYDRGVSLTQPARRKFARLMCDLNPDHCVGLSVLGGDILSQRVKRGQGIRLPHVAFAAELISSSVDLKGKSVKEHLKDRVPAAQRKKISPRDLLQLNPRFKNTFEGYLSSKRYILADALKGELQPGTIIKFDKGQEVKVDDARRCSLNLRNAISSVAVKRPAALTSRAVEAVLPWRPGRGPESSGELQRLGVSEVEVSFDKLTSERLPYTDFQESLADLYQRRCLEHYAKRYVVSEALTAAGTRYTLRRDDGSTLSLGAEELQRLHLRGRPDPSGESSFIVDEPLYLGYQLLHRAQEYEDYVAGAQWREVTDYREVKPDSPQNIFNQTRGVFELPVTRWRANLFVHADDLRGESGLRQVTSRQGIYVLSEQESSLSGSAAVTVGISFPQGADTLEDIRRQRELLKEKISYVPPPEEVSDIEIGIGEDERSIDFHHPDFYDEGGNAWYRLTENAPSNTKDWAPLPKPASTGAFAEPLKKNFSEQEDHGSHVAGLLAARKNTVAGLLPSAQLFLLNNGSVAALEESIEAAIKRGIYIFNFSFTTKVQGDDTFIDLKKKMRTEPRWRQRLFVVAAGNDNNDLRDLPERFAISWAAKEANILGVGASDGNNNFLGQWTPDLNRPDRVMPGSNWSKEHVHLLAPGKEIWSTASGNKYAVATGTSMAVPLVTAAAAVLLGQGVTEAVWIKLRLIYTADWFSPQFDDKVWGGQLNYGRAVWQPSHNLISTQSAPRQYSSVEFDERAEIEVRKGQIDDRRGEPAAAPNKIPLKNVLRIQRLGQPANGLFNVIYLQDDNVRRLRVLRNAEISGQVGCRWVREWDAVAKEFGPKKQNCGTLDVSSTFHDYVARVPRVPHGVVTF
jgi:hypothetical protein